MAEPPYAWDSLDQITVDFFDPKAPHRQLCRQLSRTVVERGNAWAVLLFVFERVQGQGQKWRRRVALHRYRRIGGGWRRHSAITMAPETLKLAAAAMQETD